jgi:hypothetical protein
MNIDRLADKIENIICNKYGEEAIENIIPKIAHKLFERHCVGGEGALGQINVDGLCDDYPAEDEYQDEIDDY